MRHAFFRTLETLAAADPNLWLLTGDVGYSVVEPFAAAHPGRFLNTGIAEQNMAGVAAGLARCGHRVFTYSIANFPTLRCLEQIRNDICYHNLPVCIVSVGGGFCYGAQGYTHHGLEDLAVMRCLPHMTVVAPGDPVETRLALQAIARLDGPAYLRLGKAGEPLVHAADPPDFALGRALTLRQGRDGCLLATGGLLAPTVQLADELHREFGVSPRVLSLPTLKPLDHEAIRAAARETPILVTLEEHSSIGGLGSAVAEVLAQMGNVPPLRLFAAPDALTPAVGGQEWMRHRHGAPAAFVRRALAEAGVIPPSAPSA
ncbi:MAG: transketolase [Magnetococcales bacterium]|nr:transketolase [Magnetococcales bacterium]